MQLVYKSNTSQNFRLFFVSNLSDLNFLFVLLMYPGWRSPPTSPFTAGRDGTGRDGTGWDEEVSAGTLRYRYPRRGGLSESDSVSPGLDACRLVMICVRVTAAPIRDDTLIGCFPQPIENFKLGNFASGQREMRCLHTTNYNIPHNSPTVFIHLRLAAPGRRGEFVLRG